MTRDRISFQALLRTLQYFFPQYKTTNVTQSILTSYVEELNHTSNLSLEEIELICLENRDILNASIRKFNEGHSYPYLHNVLDYLLAVKCENWTQKHTVNYALRITEYMKVLIDQSTPKLL